MSVIGTIVASGTRHASSLDISDESAFSIRMDEEGKALEEGLSQKILAQCVSALVGHCRAATELYKTVVVNGEQV